MDEIEQIICSECDEETIENGICRNCHEEFQNIQECEYCGQQYARDRKWEGSSLGGCTRCPGKLS